MGRKAIVAEAGPASLLLWMSTEHTESCRHAPAHSCTSVLDALRGPEGRAALPKEEERLRQGMGESSGVRPEGVTPTTSRLHCWTASGSTFPKGGPRGKQSGLPPILSSASSVILNPHLPAFSPERALCPGGSWSGTSWVPAPTQSPLSATVALCLCGHLLAQPPPAGVEAAHSLVLWPLRVGGGHHLGVPRSPFLLLRGLCPSSCTDPAPVRPSPVALHPWLSCRGDGAPPASGSCWLQPCACVPSPLVILTWGLQNRHRCLTRPG